VNAFVPNVPTPVGPLPSLATTNSPQTDSKATGNRVCVETDRTKMSMRGWRSTRRIRFYTDSQPPTDAFVLRLEQLVPQVIDVEVGQVKCLHHAQRHRVGARSLLSTRTPEPSPREASLHSLQPSPSSLSRHRLTAPLHRERPSLRVSFATCTRPRRGHPVRAR
jgi:hypothetical protein